MVNVFRCFRILTIYGRNHRLVIIQTPCIVESFANRGALLKGECMWCRCKSNKHLEDPRLTAAAAAAVAEAEAEERALAAALEAIARLPPRPDRGPRRSLCVEVSLRNNVPKQPLKLEDPCFSKFKANIRTS